MTAQMHEPTSLAARRAEKDADATGTASVTKALRLLDVFRSEGPVLGVSELARQAGVAKSTAFRLLALLEDAELVERDGRGYRLSWRLFELGTSVQRRWPSGLREIAAPWLTEVFVRAGGNVVHLAVLDGSDVLYLDRVSSPRSPRVPTAVGMRVPATCTGLGKAMLAFGARVDRDAVPVEGIGGLDEVDHRFAERFGYTIKHLAIGRDHCDSIELRVHPALVPSKSVLANVSGVLNAVHLHGKALGPCLVYGRGAGDLPTAVSVVADVIDVARSIVAGVAGLQTRSITLAPRPLRPLADVETRYYLRFSVADQPGVMAKLAGALGDAGVSIEQIVQEAEPSQSGGPAEVVMLTHRAREGAVRGALEAIAKESFLLRPVRLVRIEAA